MTATGNVQVGMQAYSSDGKPLGTVDSVSDEGISVDGVSILSAMVTGVSGDRVELNYTGAQFLWQSAPRDEKDDAVSWEPTDQGGIVEMLDQRDAQRRHAQGEME